MNKNPCYVRAPVYRNNNNANNVQRKFFLALFLGFLFCCFSQCLITHSRPDPVSLRRVNNHNHNQVQKAPILNYITSHLSIESSSAIPKVSVVSRRGQDTQQNEQSDNPTPSAIVPIPTVTPTFSPTMPLPTSITLANFDAIDTSQPIMPTVDRTEERTKRPSTSYLETSDTVVPDAEQPTPGPTGALFTDQQSNLCQNNPGCSLLIGECCPNANGLLLECCSIGVVLTEDPVAIETEEPTPPEVTTNRPSPTPSNATTEGPTATQTTIPATSTPTDSPTLSPTVFGTMAPTVIPTKITSQPTKRPRNSPTENPSQVVQTSNPTGVITTSKPTGAVTTSPTSSPTDALTTKSPTSADTTLNTTIESTNIPTTENEKSILPTRKETDAPTEFPAGSPSLFQTINPTESDSAPDAASPTISPLKSVPSPPTESPTLNPTVSAAPSSSFQPSAMPTPVYEFEKLRLYTPDVIMEFMLDTRRLVEGNSTISDECIEIWQKHVSSRITDEVDLVVPIYETLKVSVLNYSNAIRNSSLIFSFGVVIDIRSALKTHDVNRYIEGPFDSQPEKDDLIQYLRTSPCKAFGAIRDVSLVVPDRDVSGVQGVQPEESNSQIGMIIGLGVAIVAILMLTGTFVYLKTRNRRRLLDDDDEEIFDNRSIKENAKEYQYVSEIGCLTNQEVSTLGDPIPAGTRPFGDDLSTLESTSLDYDYQRAFVDAQTTAGGVSEITDNNLLDGNDEFHAEFDSNKSPIRGSAVPDPTNYTEELYEVLAPPGVLGLIIESSKNGGYPTVHSIKRNSVLSGVVKEGDRIVSIDEQNVTEMIASDASRLIASKKDQPIRTFVFGRSMIIRERS